MIWLALALTAWLAAPSVASGDGQPPVTIIEIPTATTTATSLVPPEISVATTSPAPALIPSETSVLPTSPTPTTSPAPATSLPRVEDQVSPPVRSPIWLWLRGVILVLGGLLVVALVRLNRNSLPGNGAPPATPEPKPPPAVSPSSPGRYEAVEYRSESGTSEVRPRALGEFGTLEEAIDIARLARAGFALDSGTDRFWVVWNLDLKRAAWIAESGTPGERVIDLRTGRRQPYVPESTKT